MIKYLSVIILLTVSYLLITINVHAGQFTVSDAAAFQSTVDKAIDGDTIMISGTLSGPIFIPFNGKMAVNSCFVDLKGKKLTLKGGKLFGQGHETTDSHHPGDSNDKYYHRAGICSEGGSFTIDGVDIREFEGGGLYFSGAKVVLKNSTVQGNDHGGISLFDSSLLAVNNTFLNAIGSSGNSNIKAYSNTFISDAIHTTCHQDVPPIEFVNNIVTQMEVGVSIGGFADSNCSDKVDQFKNQKIEYNLLWKKKDWGWYPQEYQGDFKGKILADPLINDICTEPGGMCGGSIDPQAGSPALTGGNPTISTVLGATGGPCINPASTTCTQFIAANQPPEPQIKPTEPPEPTKGPTPTGTNNKQKPTGQPKEGIFPQIINPYNLPEVFGKLINLPNNITYTQEKTTKASSSGSGMDLILYIAFSAVYIMFIHFAVGIKNEFSIFWMIGYFVLGGVIGGWFHLYEAGFVFSIIMSLLFF